MKVYYCEACGRQHNGKHSSHYCHKHQYQIVKYGKLLDCNPRTKFDANEFRFSSTEPIVEFDTYNLPSLDVCSTYIIDTKYYPLVSKYKWRTIKGGYASTIMNGKSITLHRLIMNAKDGQLVDHIDINPTNNRESNLRFTTYSVNSMNRKAYNKYGIKGIELHENKKTKDKYSAYFRCNNKQYHSPCYDTIEEAMFARFILEQMFSSDYLYREDNSIDIDIYKKKTIIKGLQLKFNK